MVSKKILKTNVKRKDTDSLRRHIVRVLAEWIYSGYLPPGSRLVESELAEKLKISRTPVREAILQLESEGLVKVLPNKGAIVSIYSVGEIEEIYTIYSVLEGLAASLSAELISENGLKRMERCVAKMAASKGMKDRIEWFSWNSEFHSIFIRLCGKMELLKLIKKYTKQISRYWYLTSHPENMEVFDQEHERILEAFKSRNSKMARESVENHLRSVGKIVVENLASIPSYVRLNYPGKPGVQGE